MKKIDSGFKILAVTLTALVLTGLLHHFVYVAFCMEKTGQIFWFSRDLWKKYWAWLPGKVLCIALVSLILSLIIEAVYFIFCGRKK